MKFLWRVEDAQEQFWWRRRRRGRPLWENWRNFFEELKKAKIIFGGGEDKEEDHYEKNDEILATTKENLQSRRQKFENSKIWWIWSCLSSWFYLVIWKEVIHIRAWKINESPTWRNISDNFKFKFEEVIHVRAWKITKVLLEETSYQRWFQVPGDDQPDKND